MEKANMENYPLPSKEIEEWSDLELGVIIHHLLETHNPDVKCKHYGHTDETLPAESFNPVNVDTDQWMAAAKAMGAKYAVFVANHSSGFSMWPTKANDYSVKSSPYKDGNADIVKDFLESCKKYKIKPGIYYSTGCNGFYGYMDNESQDHTTEKYQEYSNVVMQQLEELWTEYGDIFEIWFDGGIVPKKLGGADVYSLLKKYQPNAVCFQGPQEHNKNVRWVGNERGVAPTNCWSTANSNTCAYGGDVEDIAVGLGSPNGKYWIPAEADMGNRRKDAFGGGWVWKEGEEDKCYTPEELLDRYYTSVGRNTNLLVGMAIDDKGLFSDVEQFTEFGKLVKQIYENPVKSTRGVGKEFVLELEEEEFIKNISIMEDIHYGERVRNFSVYVERPDGQEEIFNANCIGHKRLVKLNEKVKKIVLIINECIDTPIIKEFTVYK